MAGVKGNLNELTAIMGALKKKYTLRIGIIGNKNKAHEDSELTNGQLGAVHEFGANIQHPGGTPYKILPDGTALFVKRSKGSNLPVTKPHNIQIPQRSFLYKPLVEKLNFKNGDMKKLKKLMFKQFFDKKAPKRFYLELGSKALEIVNGAFETQGYGQWAPLSSGTISKRNQKGEILPLVATGQLKNSTAFEVKEN